MYFNRICIYIIFYYIVLYYIILYIKLKIKLIFLINIIISSFGSNRLIIENYNGIHLNTGSVMSFEGDSKATLL